MRPPSGVNTADDDDDVVIGENSLKYIYFSCDFVIYGYLCRFFKPIVKI